MAVLVRAIQTWGAGWQALHRAAARFGHLILPPLCLSCRKQVDGDGVLCAACWSDIRFIEAPFCPVTGLPMPYDPGPGIVSAVALADPPPYSMARAVMFYGGRAAELVHRFKYADGLEATPMFARWMHRAGRDVLQGADHVIPVPLHRTKLFSRRFNQSAELARALASLAGLAFQPEVLEKTRATRPQVGLSGAARQRNVKGAFQLRSGTEPLVRDRIVVLVDDVVTTGATINACSKALLKAGAREVRVLALARVVPDEGAPI